MQLLRTTLLVLASSMLLQAQKPPPFEPNYDEEKANTYPIPHVLAIPGVDSIKTKEDWLSKGRPALMKLFAQEVYGKTPANQIPVKVEPHGKDKTILNGKAIMRQAIMHLGPKGEVQAHLLIYLPTTAVEKKAPVPAFITLNFWGNHSVDEDPDILLSPSWFRNNKDKGIVNNRATEASRGTGKDRFPIEAIINRGYAVITAYYGDFDPDYDDGFENGIHPLFHQNGAKPAADEWGSIGAWAWGMSRMADYAQSLPEIDSGKLISLGHSRLGKTSLWAGAQDERFSIVISNNSGCGGAAPSKRTFGETVWRINNSFPHWFCDNFNRYSNNEGELPIDQHQLIALMAPRPVYIASATEDKWADPKGEFLSGKLAEPVYQLFDKPGLGVDSWPAPDTPVGKFIGYHLRTGKHDVTPYDWERYMDFADQHWR